MKIQWTTLSKRTGVPARTLIERYGHTPTPIVVARIVVDLGVPIREVITRR